MNLFSVILYIFSFSVPLQLLGYYAFWDNLRFSKGKVLFILASVIIAKIILILLAADTTLEMRILDALFAPVHLLVFLINIRMNFFKVLFTYIFLISYGSIINGLAVFSTVCFFNGAPASELNSLFCLLFYAISFPFIMRFFHSLARQIYQLDSPIWKTIWIPPCFTTLLVLWITTDFSEKNIKSAPFLLARCGLILMTLIVYRLLLNALELFQKQAVLETEKKQLGKILELQKDHYCILKDKMNENRRFRHDMKHQLAVLQRYAAENQTEKLNSYLNNILGEIPAGQQVLCSNESVNAVALYYQNQAQAAGISDLSLQLSAIPADCGSCENDLCIVIGNLLENAVRASKEASDPFIQLNCRFEQGLLSLSMTNSYASVSRAGDGTFLTTRDGGGIGLLSIRFIAERYGGSCRFEAENGSFYSLVYMNIDHLSPDGTGILDDTKAAAPTGTM